MDKNMDVWIDNKIVWKHISLSRLSFGLSWNTDSVSVSSILSFSERKQIRIQNSTGQFYFQNISTGECYQKQKVNKTK